MSKKSSIEWLVDELTNLGYIYAPSFGHKTIADKIEQAKIKHKEEQEQLSARWAKLREQTRETAMHIGFARGFECGLKCFEDYYEELNKTDLDEDEFTRNYITDRFEEIYNGGNNEQQAK